MEVRLAGCHIDGDVLAQAVVVEKVPFDDVAFVSEGDEELAKLVFGVQLHDVPEDRPAADIDHRLWSELGFLGETRAEAPGQDHYFHSRRLLPAATISRAYCVGEYRLADAKFINEAP